MEAAGSYSELLTGMTRKVDIWWTPGLRLGVMVTSAKSIRIAFANWDKRGTVPSWAKEFDTVRATVSDVAKTGEVPAVIVLQAREPVQFSKHRVRVGNLGARLQKLPQPPRIVVSFAANEVREPQNMVDVMRLFPKSISPQIEFSWGKENLRASLYEALAKMTIQEGAANGDPLAEAKEVVRATRPLLAESGRLSARTIAKTFGMSLSLLASLIGRSKQSVSKTPDAPKIQPALRPYERIARLRSLFTDADFRAWLERPNPHLDDRTPMDVILSKQASAVADLVEDMLLGSPG